MTPRRLPRQLLLALAGLAAATVAGAQSASTVQVYGQVTAALTHRDHQTGASSVTEVGNSQFAASLIGFRGTEDLGGGMSAVFRLEAGFATDTGVTGATIGTANKFFNRQSFVGLNLSPAATVTLGRQFHAATDRVIQTLDLFNVGGTTLAVTPHALFGVNKFSGNDARADDSLKLRLRGPAGLTGAISGSFNETGAGRHLGSYSLVLAQVTPGYAVGAYVVNFQSPTVAANGTRPRHKALGFGGNTALGPVTAYLHWMDARLEPSAAGRVEQKNIVLHLGANWQLASNTALKLGAYHDKGTALNGVVGRNGTKDTLIAMGEYSLSKRTSVHAAWVSNRFADGYKLDPTNIAALGRDPNASSTRWVTLGMRHDF